MFRVLFSLVVLVYSKTKWLRKKQLRGKRKKQEWLTNALSEAWAEEETVDGEALEALLHLGPPLGDGGLVEELEAPERAGGARDDAPVEPAGAVPVPVAVAAEQRRERHGGALDRGDATEVRPRGPELGRQAPRGSSSSRAGGWGVQERRGVLRVAQDAGAAGKDDVLDGPDGDVAAAVVADVERDLDVLVLVLEPRAPAATALAVRGRALERRRRRRSGLVLLARRWRHGGRPSWVDGRNFLQCIATARKTSSQRPAGYRQELDKIAEAWSRMLHLLRW